MGNIPWFEMVWNPNVFPCLQQHDSVVPAWHFISIAAGIHPWDDMGWLLTPFWWRQLRQLDKKVDLVQLMQSLNWVPYFQAFWIILMDSSETTILERPISSETLKPHFGESHPSNMRIRNFRHVGYIRQIPSYVMDFPVLFNNPPGWMPGHLRSGSAARRSYPRSHPKSVRESSGFVQNSRFYVLVLWII